MEERKDGDLTKLAIREIKSVDHENEDIWSRDFSYFEELAESNFFYDSIVKYIKDKEEELNFDGDLSDKEVIRLFLGKCYDEAGLENCKRNKDKTECSYNPQSLKKWLDGEADISIKEAYKISFCLKMNVEEASEFILKGCLSRPFNFKNISEATYYFCLNTGRDYKDAVDIIQEIEAADFVDNPCPEKDTVGIKNKISELKSREQFLKYMIENKNGFVLQSRSALKQLELAIQECVKYAEKDREINYTGDNIGKIKSEKDVSKIFHVILGYKARRQEGGKNTYDFSIKKSRLPQLVKRNFPQEQAFLKIFDKETPSDEIIRKAIILFTFYQFFMQKKEAKTINTNKDTFDEFRDAMDEILIKCGYGEMYPRNPYDWIFAYCSRAQDPIEEFRNFISYYYLDDCDY